MKPVLEFSACPQVSSQALHWRHEEWIPVALLHLPAAFVENNVKHGTSVWCLSSSRNAHELSEEGRQDFTVDWHVLLDDV